MLNAMKLSMFMSLKKKDIQWSTSLFTEKFFNLSTNYLPFSTSTGYYHGKYYQN